MHSTPSAMSAIGAFDIEFRIVVATRERTVCLLRRGWLEGKIIFQTTESIVDALQVEGDNFIYVATSDKMLSCYTKRVNIITERGGVTVLSIIFCCRGTSCGRLR